MPVVNVKARGAARGARSRGVPVPPLEAGRIDRAAGWPLRTFLDLGAYREAVPCARLHARQVAWEWGFTALARTCELVVSELVTNSVYASVALREFTTVRLWLLSDSCELLILVWDASRYPPRPVAQGTRELDEGGLGLLLVTDQCEEWSWYFTRDRGGKVVWALLRREQP